MHTKQQSMTRFILFRLFIFVFFTASFVLGEDEGTQPPTTTPAPIVATPEPVTPQPAVTTPAPVTPAPITPQPVTPAPVTPQPTTPAPITPQPITPAPITPQPVVTTPAPVTPAPIATSAPTIFICEVCPDGLPVTFPENMVGDISCQQLQDLGLEGSIPQANCVGAQNAVPALCGCGTAAPVITPSPSTAPSPGAAGTDAPSTTPTTTPATTSPSASPTGTSTGTPTAPTTPETTNSTQTPTMLEEPPSSEPSMGPSGVVTTPPSENPSSMPTDSATDGPSEVPSLEPTLAPASGEPSEQPSEVPSTVPSEVPSQAPTENTGTNPPTIVEQYGAVMDAQMTLQGLSFMDGTTEDAWIEITEQFSGDYFQNSLESYETNITIKSFITRRRVVGRGILRGLQSPSLIVVYDQEFLYRSDASTVTPDLLATAPFSSESDRDVYTNRLIDQGGSGFADLEGVSAVEVPPEPTEAPAPTPTAAPSQTPVVAPPTDSGKEDEKSGLSTGAIIGIAVAGGVALILCCLGIFFMSGGDDDDKDQKSEDAPDEVKVATAGGGGDEVSALEPPPAGASSNAGSPSGYGDQSVATVDYDYSKAYGGGGDTSVSSAGGTFGSNTQGQSQAVAATAGALGNFEDGESLDKDPNSSMKEDLINVFAPPGKLGVVIDTPDDGAPVVHAVKESSIIADKIKVGDKLVAVDDEDVRSMTAIKVSKLISRKSSNPTRKLTVIRTSVVEG